MGLPSTELGQNSVTSLSKLGYKSVTTRLNLGLSHVTRRRVRKAIAAAKRALWSRLRDLTSSGRFRSAPLTLRWITTRKRLPGSTGRARRKQRSACGRRPPPAPFRGCKSRDMRRVEDQISARVRTWSSGVQQPRYDTAPAAARRIGRPVAPPRGHGGDDDAYPDHVRVSNGRAPQRRSAIRDLAMGHGYSQLTEIAKCCDNVARPQQFHLW